MSKLSPFDAAMELTRPFQRDAPPGALDAAVETFEALKLAKAALVELFPDAATPDRAILVMQAMLRQAIARTQLADHAS